VHVTTSLVQSQDHAFSLELGMNAVGVFRVFWESASDFEHNFQ